MTKYIITPDGRAPPGYDYDPKGDVAYISFEDAFRMGVNAEIAPGSYTVAYSPDDEPEARQ